MAFIDTGGAKSNSFQEGSKLYIFLLTLVATLGGLLFGYDTAVVNGAEKSLVEFYIYTVKAGQYVFNSDVMSLFAQYRTLMVIVLYLVFIVISAQIIGLLGKKKGGIGAAVIMIALTAWAVSHSSL
jgi:SP family xylose:H+ symportor-like MFS transporter